MPEFCFVPPSQPVSIVRWVLSNCLSWRQLTVTQTAYVLADPPSASSPQPSTVSRHSGIRFRRVSVLLSKSRPLQLLVRSSNICCGTPRDDAPRRSVGVATSGTSCCASRSSVLGRTVTGAHSSSGSLSLTVFNGRATWLHLQCKLHQCLPAPRGDTCYTSVRKVVPHFFGFESEARGSRGNKQPSPVPVRLTNKERRALKQILCLLPTCTHRSPDTVLPLWPSPKCGKASFRPSEIYTKQ